MIYTVVGLLVLGRRLDIVAIYGILIACMLCFSSFVFFFGSRVCMCVCVCVCVCDNLCCFPSDVCYFVQDNNTCSRVAGSPRWERVQY